MKRTMRDIVRDILTWPWFSEPHGYDFNGHVVRDPGGNVCIDPVEPSDDALEVGAIIGPLQVVDASGKSPGEVALLWRDRQPWLATVWRSGVPRFHGRRW